MKKPRKTISKKPGTKKFILIVSILPVFIIIVALLGVAFDQKLDIIMILIQLLLVLAPLIATGFKISFIYQREHLRKEERIENNQKKNQRQKQERELKQEETIASRFMQITTDVFCFSYFAGIESVLLTIVWKQQKKIFAEFTRWCLLLTIFATLISIVICCFHNYISVKQKKTDQEYCWIMMFLMLFNILSGNGIILNLNFFLKVIIPVLLLILLFCLRLRKFYAFTAPKSTEHRWYGKLIAFVLGAILFIVPSMIFINRYFMVHKVADFTIDRSDTYFNKGRSIKGRKYYSVTGYSQEFDIHFTIDITRNMYDNYHYGTNMEFSLYEGIFGLEWVEISPNNESNVLIRWDE